jgi:hypothetical protein
MLLPRGHQSRRRPGAPRGAPPTPRGAHFVAQGPSCSSHPAGQGSSCSSSLGPGPFFFVGARALTARHILAGQGPSRLSHLAGRGSSCSSFSPGPGPFLFAGARARALIVRYILAGQGPSCTSFSLGPGPFLFVGARALIVRHTRAGQSLALALALKTLRRSRRWRSRRFIVVGVLDARDTSQSLALALETRGRRGCWRSSLPQVVGVAARDCCKL